MLWYEDKVIASLLTEIVSTFYGEGKRHLFTTFEMTALQAWRGQRQGVSDHIPFHFQREV